MEELPEPLGGQVPVGAGHVAPVQLHLRQREVEDLGGGLHVGHLSCGVWNGLGGIGVGPGKILTPWGYVSGSLMF